MSATTQFDGSRRYVLDWIESSAFLETVRGWVSEFGFSIPVSATWMPKSWNEPTESKPFDVAEPFLSTVQRDALQGWWLAHKGNIPNWDLIVTATATMNQPALVLVEAKANTHEFDCKPKPKKERKTPDAQERTDENHQRIGHAIAEAAAALVSFHPAINISRDRCYQLSNRLATAWKLASIGVPNTLIFLGFTGDREIAREGMYFAHDRDWQRAFSEYADPSFPSELLGQEVPCGAASFRLIARSLSIARTSRPIAERRIR